MPECDSCHCTIGLGFAETARIPVGTYGICGHCHHILIKRDRVEIARGKNDVTISFLLPSGQVETRQLILHRNKHYELRKVV